MIKKDSYWHGAVTWALPALWTGFVLGMWVAGVEKVFGYAILLYAPVFIVHHLVQALIKKYGQQSRSSPTGPLSSIMNHD